MKAVFLAFLFAVELAAGDPTRDAQWQQDLSYLAAQLPARHPSFYTLVPQAQFNQAVASLAAAIPNSTDTQVMLGLAGIVALANDGHTNLFLTQRNATFHLLPIATQWFQDGLFVTRASSAYARALGAKVLKIGNKSADDAYAAVAPAISHENDIWVRATSPTYLNNADILQPLNIASSNLTVTLVLQDLAGIQFSIDIASLDPGQGATLNALPDPSAGFTPLYRQNTNQNYWFRYIPSSLTLYFAYNVCANMPSLPFAQFNDQLWATFDTNPVDAFIIDLRNNGGGDSSVLNPFLLSGVQRQARFSATSVYVIIGRNTYSSAILNAISMQQGPVVLVGEPTGGSPNTYGEVQSFVLPNSQLTVNYSTKYFSFPQYPPGSMIPDVQVPSYSADYFARHDPFLAAALANQPPQSASTSNTGPLTIVNAATFRTDLAVAPGSLATAFGDFSGITPSTAQLLVDGTSATLNAVTPGQINFLVPPSTASGTRTFEVQNSGMTVVKATSPVAATAPALFIADGQDTARPAAALDQNFQPLVNGVQPGSIIQLFGTGQGVATPRTKVYIGAEQANVLFSGPQPVFPGLWQINVQVPDTASISGQVPLFVTAGSQPGNGVSIKVNR